MLIYQVKSRTVANKDLGITFCNRWIGTFSGNYMYSNTISPKQRKFQIWLPSILQFSTKMLIDQVKSTKVAKISETVFKLQSRNFCLQNSKGHNSNTWQASHGSCALQIVSWCLIFVYRVETDIYNVQRGITLKSCMPELWFLLSWFFIFMSSFIKIS